MRRGRRHIGAVLVGAGVLLGSAGCGGPGVVRQETVGRSGTATIVLSDAALRDAVAAAATSFSVPGRARIVWSVGTPDAVAGAVKDGQPVDVVLLPDGAALDRVRDELVEPPVPLGTHAGTAYSAAAVTGRGVAFLRFLVAGGGAARLRQHGVVR
jgi:ABC-type molybdate transport system substrate-binding protein